MSGEEATTSLLSCADALGTILVPIDEESHSYMKQEMLQACEKIMGALADVDADVATFHAHFSCASLRALRKSRETVKDKWNVLKHCFQAADGESVKVDNIDVVKVMLDARCQTVKWGLVCFMQNPDIKARTVDGVSLRKQLRGVWSVNAEDRTICEFLGKDLCGCIKLLIDPAFGKGKDQGAQVGAKKKAKKQQAPGKPSQPPTKKARVGH